MLRAYYIVSLLLATVACSDKKPARETPPPTPAPIVPRDAAPPDAAPSLTWFRVEASPTERDRIPFLLGVDPAGTHAVIDAGDEKLELVVLSHDPLSVRIPVRGMNLDFGAPDASGTLHGTWKAAYYYKKDFPLTAVPIDGPRVDALFPGTEAPAVDLTGTWRIDIKDFGVGRAVFAQDASGTLTGTIIPPEVGDLRHLLGRVVGTRAQLSVFDGIHGFYIAMTASNGGKKLTGTWVISGIGTFAFTATRAPAPATHLVLGAHMAPGKTRVSLPELDKPPYKGNPVIVDFFGSWCPVCMDLTPQLVRLRAEHAKDGLQILSIALEPPGDEAETAKRLEEFRTQFGVTWPFSVRYTDDFNGEVPPEVLGADGFPVTIFVRRDGTVAGVHTGFVSDAARDEHKAVVERFEQLTNAITAP